MSSFLFTGELASYSSSAHVQNHTEAPASTQKHAGQTEADQVRGLQLETVSFDRLLPSSKTSKTTSETLAFLVVRVKMHWISFCHIFRLGGGGPSE